MRLKFIPDNFHRSKTPLDPYDLLLRCMISYENGDYEKIIYDIDKYRISHYILPYGVSQESWYIDKIKDIKEEYPDKEDLLTKTTEWSEVFTDLTLNPAYYVSFLKSNLPIKDGLDLLRSIEICFDKPRDTEINYELWIKIFDQYIKNEYGSIRQWIYKYVREIECEWNHFHWNIDPSIHTGILIKPYNYLYYSRFITEELYYSRSLDNYWDLEKHRPKDRWFENDEGITKSLTIISKILFREDFKRISKLTSNSMRKELGLELNTIRWKNEDILFSQLKSHFTNETLVFQSSPDFLREQVYDIYLPNRKIAIEYNGIQHYKPVDFFGGENGFISTIERDNRKRLLSKKNGIVLIEVQEGYKFENLVNLLEKDINGDEVFPHIDIRHPNKELFQVEISQYYIDYFQVKKSKKSKKVYDKNVLIYDCKLQESMTFREFQKSFPNIDLSTFYSRNSVLKRFILNEHKGDSIIPKGWKNIRDIKDDQIFRFNKTEFAKHVNVSQNSVWGFFNGKQKVFNGRYIIEE